MRIRPAFGLILLGCLPTGSGFAHPGHDGGLLTGLLHPLTGLDHALAMLAVGWWSACAGGRRWWQAPLLFAATAFLTALATYGLGFKWPGIEWLIAGSLLVLAALLWWQPAVKPVALGLIAALALAHGAAHGAELKGPVLPWLLGMLVATLALHLLGALLGRQLRQRSGVLGQRVAAAGLLTFVGLLWQGLPA